MTKEGQFTICKNNQSFIKFSHLWVAKLCFEVKKRLHSLQFVLTEFLTCFRCFFDFSWTWSCLTPSKNRLQVLQYSLGFLSLYFLTIGTSRFKLMVWVVSRAGDDGLELEGVVALEGMSPPSPSLSTAESSMKLFLEIHWFQMSISQYS